MGSKDNNFYFYFFYRVFVPQKHTYIHDNKDFKNVINIFSFFALCNVWTQLSCPFIFLYFPIHFIPFCRKNFPQWHPNGLMPLKKEEENRDNQVGIMRYKDKDYYKAHAMNYDIYLWILWWLCNVESSLNALPQSVHSYLPSCRRWVGRVVASEGGL